MKISQMLGGTLVGIALLFPAVAPAATTADLNGQLLSLLQQLVVVLETELQQLLSGQTTTVPVTNPVTINPVTTPSGVTTSTAAPILTVFPVNTINTTPIISGTSNETAPVSISVNGVTFSANVSGGLWSATVILPLPVGTYTISVSSTNTSGQTGTATGVITVAHIPTSTTSTTSAATTITNSTSTAQGATSTPTSGTSCTFQNTSFDQQCGGMYLCPICPAGAEGYPANGAREYWSTTQCPYSSLLSCPPSA